MHDPQPLGAPWLASLLAREHHCAYLRHWGAPRDLAAFRAQVPRVDADTLLPWVQRVSEGEADTLFLGRPLAFEQTSGSTRGPKLVPYSAHGLHDIQRALAPWLNEVVGRYRVDGSVYLATSPATRPARKIGDVPLGLPDGAYLGPDWGVWVLRHSAVPFEVAEETSMDRWRARTLAALREARSLQLISVWSPSFMLRLLDELPDPTALWPQLRLVSCWADAASRGAAAELRARLPQAHMQAKGLMSTECVVTVPDDQDRPVLNPHGFFEFEDMHGLWLDHELNAGSHYEVVATTASGLYRYRTADQVRCLGHTSRGHPILGFEGRGGLWVDLVGEKLNEAFVAGVLGEQAGACVLAPRADGRGYEVLSETAQGINLSAIEQGLRRSPQYAYARDLGQLQPLTHRTVPQFLARLEDRQVAAGARLADVKPLALLRDASWTRVGISGGIQN